MSDSKNTPTKTMKLRVWCQAFYDTTLEVPANLNKEEAFEYAKEHLDEAPLTSLNYLEDSDNLDEEDLAFPNRITFYNTEISYLNRDDSNYKSFASVILPGIMTESQKNEFKSYLLDNECFVPELVDWPAERNWDYRPDCDTPLWEITGIAPTMKSSTIQETIPEVLSQFNTHKDEWETYNPFE